MSQRREFIQEYKRNWKSTFDRVRSDSIPESILKYQPKGEGSLRCLK
jgi:hypothetical protein